MVSRFVRRVRTASGSVAVQVALDLEDIDAAAGGRRIWLARGPRSRQGPGEGLSEGVGARLPRPAVVGVCVVLLGRTIDVNGQQLTLDSDLSAAARGIVDRRPGGQ